MRHCVVIPLARLAQRVERARVLPGIPFLSDSLEPSQLSFVRFLRNPQGLDLGPFLDHKIVHADDRSLLVLDLLLIAICGIRTLLLEEAISDGADHAPE